MAYGIGGPLFLGGSLALHAERANFARSNSSARAWRALNAQSRLEMVEKALGTPANDDLPDNLPVAL